MSAQVELWRVSTIEGVFETDLETLKQWIAEGCVLPTDKVSKGNLNWIDAGRAPMLKAAFSGERVDAVGTITLVKEQVPPPRSESFPQTEPTPNPSDPFSRAAVQPHDSSNIPSPFVQVAMAGAHVCHNHTERLPRYVCSRCEALLCDDCPKLVNRIPLCPVCGELCKLYEEVKTKTASRQFQSSGFGLEDFGRAVRYPLQHKVALACGALMYGLLLLMGFRAAMIAYVIMFGCMSHVISQVAWGRLNRSFMPDFSEFSPWDDLVVPIFLGIGITIVTWGPVIVLVLALLFGVLSGGPGVSPLAAGEMETAEQSGPTQDDLAILTDPEADPEKLEEANRKLNEIRPAAQISQEAERSRDEQSDPAAGMRMLLPYLGAGIFLLMLFVLGLAWAVFYYPMALAVAGYTQSFGSVINPLVGLDTIRRMGSTYFKAFGMVLVVQVVALIVNVVVAYITSPLALPFMGNLPAKFIDGTVTFYFNLVIACLLGLSLYKCADRLGISVD
jgi:hypothetical protein